MGQGTLRDRFCALQARGGVDLEADASRVRAEICDPTEALPAAALATARRIGPVVWRLQVAEELPESVWAVTYAAGLGGLVTSVCETAWRELIADVPRSRFSLAHELAHVHLHHEEILEVGYLPHTAPGDETAGLPEAWDTERQANRWAGALLVPAVGLERLAGIGLLTVAEVARRYQVAERVAERRIGEVCYG